MGAALPQIVRYVGDAKFKPGVWVGVQLELPVGKNDGAVDGVRYFYCPSGHGVFVRPDAVEVSSRASSSVKRSNNAPLVIALGGIGPAFLASRQVVEATSSSGSHEFSDSMDLSYLQQPDWARSGSVRAVALARSGVV